MDRRQLQDKFRGALLGVAVGDALGAPFEGRSLIRVRFTGEVRAIPEGRLFFVDEPVVEVTAPIVEAQLHDVQLVGSGGLDEFALAELSRQDAPYDSYGVGTRLGGSADAPACDMAYKLVHYAARPVLKLSLGKVTLPDAKRVDLVQADAVSFWRPCASSSVVIPSSRRMPHESW